ncbi:MAG: SDR family oxidoreductase [Chloroflexi bacterium]|nr:SDR family oxidoreductase [Chloroflexota bacterium]
MAGVLDGETALVTGGGRGIGRGIAEAFAAAGARVALLARSTDQVDDAARAITAAGGQAVALVGDVSNPTDVQRAAAQAEDAFGTISVLVSNAGITGPYAPIWDSDPEEWWRTQEIHVHGAFLCTRAVYPGMVARGGGRIIVISSRAAERGNPNVSAYQVAKTAQLRFVEILAAEAAEVGIKAWSVHPGNVVTQFTDAAINRADAQKYVPGMSARMRETRADPSLGTPLSRVADLSVFLAAGHADQLSGRYFRIEEDWEEIARSADTIQRDDLYTLRLRTLTEPGGPPAVTIPRDH